MLATFIILGTFDDTMGWLILFFLSPSPLTQQSQRPVNASSRSRGASPLRQKAPSMPFPALQPAAMKGKSSASRFTSSVITTFKAQQRLQQVEAEEEDEQDVAEYLVDDGDSGETVVESGTSHDSRGGVAQVVAALKADIESRTTIKGVSRTNPFSDGACPASCYPS